MNSNNGTARLAGLLYLVTVVTGVFSLMYVPSHINVHGNVSATVNNILASESLFRLGIAVGLVGFVAFLLLPLFLYRLLSTVSRDIAIIMVVFAVSQVPIYFLAVANQLDIMSLLSGRYSALSSDQLNTKAMLLLDAYHNRILVSEIFWGLWLFPFGYLVFKSCFLPKTLGIALMIGCFSYLITFFGEILFPHLNVPNFIMLPASFGEIGICLWLLVIGARRSIRAAG